MRKAQREAQKEGISHKPPSNLSADGMDAWYLQQKQRELELRKRRQEAEALLRGYRMSALPRGSAMKAFGSPMSAVSESLEDPDCHSVSYSGTPRRHTIHAGDMPQHLLPPGSSKRGLAGEFDNESNADDLKTPTRDGSFSYGSVLSAKEKIEEKKFENEPAHFRGRHSLPGRPLGETPLPIEEKYNSKAFLPETIWRDFICDGEFVIACF